MGNLPGVPDVGSREASLKATYRAAFDFGAPAAGIALEITGSATKTVEVIGLFINRAGGATSQFTITKRSAASTGGTSTTPTGVPMDSRNAAATAVVKAFTVAPTPGASVGDIFTAQLIANESFSDVFALTVDQPVVLRGVAETLSVQSSTNATVRGFVAWIERAS